MLRTLAPGLHVIDHNSAIMGLALNGRCTIIELKGGGLWVHSPVPLTDALKEQVDTIGRVRFLVAPNLMHHLSLGDWMLRYPDAEVWAAPGLAAKRKDLRLPLTLGTDRPAWGAEVEGRLLRGTLPRLGESVFLHAPTRTLLITDLAFHFLESDSWLTRSYLRLVGAWGRMGTTPVTRAFVSDAALLRRELEEAFAWDFDRIIPCHGQVLEHGGKAALRGAWS